MINDLQIIAQSSAMARHAAERHRVIAGNVANADTPFYKALDLPAFDPKTVTGPNNTSALRSQTRAFEIEGLDTAPNGNNVALEDQMARAVESQAEHKAALRIYQKAMDLLRMSVRAR